MAFSRRSWGLHCWTKVITEHNNWESHRSINVCLITGCRKTTFLKITFLSCFLTAQQSIALMKALPDLFQSPVAPPKKLGHGSEALLHILKVRKCICIRIFTFALPYNTKSALWYLFFFLCLSAYTANITVYIVLYGCTFNTHFWVYIGPRVQCSLNTVRRAKYVLQI